ncbi:hypothetical protein GCM10010300_34370 [Streptomyces olivaceoviridis]|nr:hypothetical protein GCM10010300_34370 [Streptomyces olivaceoviridis]
MRLCIRHSALPSAVPPYRELASLGWAGHVPWVGQQSGDLLHGYFQVQSAWNSRLDLGAGTPRFLKALLHGGGAVQPLALVIVAASLVLFLLPCLNGAPLPLLYGPVPLAHRPSAPVRRPRRLVRSQRYFAHSRAIRRAPDVWLR